ncbi:hypothetical protein OIE71_16480 [Streptomyces sp. NBC_01725]
MRWHDVSRNAIRRALMALEAESCRVRLRGRGACSPGWRPPHSRGAHE